MYSHKKTAFKPLYIHQQGNVQSVADEADTCHKNASQPQIRDIRTAM